MARRKVLIRLKDGREFEVVPGTPNRRGQSGTRIYRRVPSSKKVPVGTEGAGLVIGAFSLRNATANEAKAVAARMVELEKDARAEIATEKAMEARKHDWRLRWTYRASAVLGWLTAPFRRAMRRKV